jgi:hypothetical protein
MISADLMDTRVEALNGSLYQLQYPIQAKSRSNTGWVTRARSYAIYPAHFYSYSI